MPEALVLGATGTVGSALVRELRARGLHPRSAKRAPAPGAPDDLRFDLTDPATFDRALDGVDRVFLISRPGDDRADEVAAAFVHAMRRHRVQHVVTLSAWGAGLRPEFSTRRVELLVERSDIGWTHLRPNFFMQMYFAPPLSRMVETGHIRLPAGDARVSFIDADDVARAAAAALCSREPSCAAFELSGPAAVDHEELADALETASGRRTRYTSIDEETARWNMLAAGMGEAWAARVLGFYRVVRAGGCAAVTDAYRRLTGLEPSSPTAAIRRLCAANARITQAAQIR